jgi:hypothetical protein
MEIQISTVKEKIDQILSVLEVSQPSVQIPDDHWCYWHFVYPVRYDGKKPDGSMIRRGDLRRDWKEVQDTPPAQPLLIELSNLLRVIGDDPDWNQLNPCKDAE